MSSSLFKADRQELKRLAELSAHDIGGNENSVKFKFIIPFLKSFGYKNLDFEHSAQGMRIDILIKSSGHKILVEAKGSDKNLDGYIISQLKRYCDEKSPILAIITNGEEIRFYSPFCRKADFNERLIYTITRTQLSDDDTVEKIEHILLKDCNISENIEAREREINSIKKRIQALELYYEDKIVGLHDELKSLEEQEKSIQSLINQSKNDVSDLKRERRNKIKELEEQNLIHLPTIPTSQPPNKRRSAKDFVLPTELKLHKVYKGKTFTAVTMENNRIRLDLDGETYTLNDGTLVCIRTMSPRVQAQNAWLWWKFNDPKTGNEELINVLRKK